jgi:hypothetical protein
MSSISIRHINKRNKIKYDKAMKRMTRKITYETIDEMKKKIRIAYVPIRSYPLMASHRSGAIDPKKLNMVSDRSGSIKVIRIIIDFSFII